MGNSINFLAEIAERFEATILPTPSDQHALTATSAERGFIYEIDISEWPTEHYWLDWGGHFDTFRGTQIMLYFGQYLTPVVNIASLRNTPNSILVEGRRVLIHIPMHPWGYPSYSTSFENVVPFLSNALNPDNPSNNFLREVNARVRLEPPNFSVRLSNNIAGITLKQGFSVSLHNNDGFFDDETVMNLFNTPLYLKKSTKLNPEYADFRLIRNGLIENKQTSFGRVTFHVADRFKTLEEPICEVIKQQNFDFTLNDNALNKPIPLIFGTKRIRLTRLDSTRYMTAQNATSRGTVFDREGNAITGTTFSAGILTVPNPDIEAVEANVTGATGTGIGGNRIGHIIRTILNRAGIVYNDTNFNVAEYNQYANASFQINAVITGGSIRRAIETVLKNDMAFFIQQSDGRFTLRRYGTAYATHNIPSTMITQKPSKDNARAQENYFSSCIINYDFQGDTYLSFLYDERANAAERKYRRRVQRVFDTDLPNVNLNAANNSVINLARLLSDRYTTMRQTIKLAVGVDTSGFELLDRVNIVFDINDRNFSKDTNFVITELNQSQDTMVLEAI